MSDAIFELRGVSKTFQIRQGIFARGPEFRALDDVNLVLKPGTFYALVGESGSGKTTLARLLCGLAEASSGEILFEGVPLAERLRRDPADFRARVQMVFQNPFSSLDPKWRVQRIVEEGIPHLSRAGRSARVGEAMNQVGLPLEYLARKPGALSGGERQRVAIARALAMKPCFLILDEPTSQLDVTIQAGILSLLKGLSSSLVGGILFITHDLPLVRWMAEEIFVLHEGRLVEQGKTEEIMMLPKNSYTRSLMEAVPSWP